jgi:hypothetical protein
MARSSSSAFVHWLFVVWLAFLLGWMTLLPLSGMAFEGGHCWSAYLYAWSIWTYPLSLILAFSLRRVAPFMVWFPLINVVGFLLGGRRC